MQAELMKLYQVDTKTLIDVLRQVNNLEYFIRGFAWLGCLKINSDYLSVWSDIYLYVGDPRPLDDWMEQVVVPIMDDVNEHKRNIRI